MVFTILITIVFIAELIIAFSILSWLIKLDKRVLDINLEFKEIKSKIIDIMQLCKAISEQIVELTPIWVDNFKERLKELALKQTESLMSGLLFWCINIRVIKKLRQNKVTKFISKGLSLIQNVI